MSFLPVYVVFFMIHLVYNPLQLAVPHIQNATDTQKKGQWQQFFERNRSFFSETIFVEKLQKDNSPGSFAKKAPETIDTGRRNVTTFHDWQVARAAVTQVHLEGSGY